MKKHWASVCAIAMLAAGGASAQTDADRPGAAASTTPPPALSTAPLIAFGDVSSAGAKLSGTPNWSVVYDSTNAYYAITIGTEAFFYSRYATLVTPVGITLSVNPATACKSDSVSGKLLVRCYDKNGANVKSYFSFLVQKYQ